MSSKILLVDDEPNILLGLQRTLRKQFQLETAQGGEEALALLSSNGGFAVVVADMCMPGMNGVELLREFRDRSPDTIRVMLTGNADQKTAVEAVNQGHVFQFLSKPCPPDRIANVLANALRQYQLVTAEKQLLEQTLQGAIKVMMDILAVNDPESFGRSQVLKDYVRVFRGDSQQQEGWWELELAAMLSQIGSVSIPPAVSQKARERTHLTGEEKDIIARVPEIGAGMIESIPRMENVARIIRYQAKNFDGSGFPHDGIKGTDIPRGARILKVLADLAGLEASNMVKYKALEAMQKRSGLYDPEVLEHAIKRFDGGATAAVAPLPDVKSLRCGELRVGQILVGNVEARDGMLIVAQGTKINAPLLERLKNWHRLNGLKEPIQVKDPVVPMESF